MRHNYMAYYDNVQLRPLEKADIENLRIWRNDASKTKYLRKIAEITPEMQEKWFEKYLENADEIIFAIVETKQLKRMVGSVALYNFNDDTAEVGKIQIGDEAAHGMGIGRKSLVMAMYIGFEKLSLKKIVGSVHPDNIAAYRNDMKIGFQVVGSHESLVEGYEDIIEINEARLREYNSYISEIVIEANE